MNIETSDANSIERRGIFAVGNSETQVVVKVEFISLEPSVGRRCLESHRISTDSVVKFLGSHENRELVKEELNTVLSLNELPHPTKLLSSESDQTDRSASLLLLNLDGEWGRLHLMTLKSLTQILSDPLVLKIRSRTDREIIELKWDLSLSRLDEISVNDDIFADVVLLG
jgi:hypothetical protein